MSGIELGLAPYERSPGWPEVLAGRRRRAGLGSVMMVMAMPLKDADVEWMQSVIVIRQESIEVGEGTDPTDKKDEQPRY